MSTRKAFICVFCEGVYSDEPVSECDCLMAHGKPLPHFIEGVITYPAPSDSESETPPCPKCGSTANMVPHDGEWVCHSTHPVESDTPETDAFYNGACSSVMTRRQREFARNLERRLTDTRKLADAAVATSRALKETYGLGGRHVMHEKNAEIERLKLELTDTRKLLATYSAEREHNAMLALGYKAERDALVACLAHLRSTDWFKETDDKGRRVICALLSDQIRKALTNLTP